MHQQGQPFPPRVGLSPLPAHSRTVSDETDERDDAEHLADVDDGCGCAEVWEHLSEQREAEREET